MLLTYDDLQDHPRHLNARNTLLTLLDRGIVPIINENDAVSVTELKFGDNDRLSALVANLLPADLLVLLTTADGLIRDLASPVPTGCRSSNRWTQVLKVWPRALAARRRSVAWSPRSTRPRLWSGPGSPW